MTQIDFYKDFNEEDFINDEYFQNWILKSGEEGVDVFWSRFLANYVVKAKTVEKAKKTLQTIPFTEVISEESPSNEKIKISFQQISKILGLIEKQN